MADAQRLAVWVSAAVACLMVGLLMGVLVSGKPPSQVLSVIRDPIAPASGATNPATNQPVTVTMTQMQARTQPARTISLTETRTVTTPGIVRTVTQPASTVTITQTTPATQPSTSGP